MAISLLHSKEWDDEGPAFAAQLGEAENALLLTERDDEYRNCGIDDPKIFLTTSHSPSVRLTKFAQVN